jgi:concentrative nucleoside transporter, CNT family
VVGALAFALSRTLGIGGALALGGAVHIFVGMVEAPLLVRPYLNSMSRGELFALMSCGMAGIAGTMIVIYAALLGPVIPDALAHILIASIISTPAALAAAALMVPFAPDPKDSGELSLPDPPASTMEAIVRGTNDGIGIVARIIAMLIVLVALVSLSILLWVSCRMRVIQLLCSGSSPIFSGRSCGSSASQCRSSGRLQS